MSFSWKNKLQNTVQGLNANLTDSAARLRQQLMQPSGQGPGVPPGPEGGQQQGASGEQQYVRLPVESAKKLRWFDRGDLNMLIQLHLREKQELFEANAALRQALQRRGVTEQQLEAEVVLNNTHVDRLRESDTAVGQVLAVAAQAEVERLREEVDLLAGQLDHMRQRLLAAQQAQPATPQHHVPATPSAASLAGLGLQQQDVVGAGEKGLGERVVLRLDWMPGEEGGAEGEGQVMALLSVVRDSQEEAAPGLPSLLQQLVGACEAPSAAPALLDALLLQQAHAALTQLAAQQGVGLAGAAATDGGAAGAAAGAGAGSEAGSVHGGTAVVLREHCAALEAGNARLQAELGQAQQEAAFLKDAAERKVQELRGRFSASQQHLSELLRVAQDGRLEAEARCEAAQRRLELAEARATRLDSEAHDLKAEAKKAAQEVKRLEKEVAAAEARASAADAVLLKAKGSAEADVRSAETIAQQRARIAELEGQAGALQRQLAAAHQQAQALEGRLAAAEAAAAKAAEELHELDALVSERDQLAAHLALLEAHMDETRVERSQLEASRAVAAESEAKRARAEEELVTTARLAAALEARLAKAQAQIDGLQLEVQAAEAARLAAVRSVAAQVEERWVAAGVDRELWPPAAQEEMENLEARLSAMLTALKTAQQQAEQDATDLAADRAKLAAAERRVATVEEDLAWQLCEWQARERQLEAASTAASMELGELRHAVAELGRERDKLLEEKQARERAAQQATLAIKAAKRRTGSGSIAEAPAAPNGADVPTSWLRTSTSSGDVVTGRPPSPSLVALRGGAQREALDATDLLYLKNVLLKFLDAQLGGRTQECEVLLPAVATLLRATPQEFKLLREGLQRGAGVGAMFSTSWFGSSGSAGSNG